MLVRTPVMTAPTWLEVALNGPWTRQRQPRIPITADELVAEGIACAEAGAAIVHFHAYDPATGLQHDTYELYAPVIERIRAAVDVICYPTIPIAGSGALTAAQRYQAVEKLLEAGLIDWAVVDPGSVQITGFDDVAEGRDGFLYANPEAHLRHALALAEAHGMVPSYAIYEPGFLRLGAALHKAQPDAPQPIYRFMFSDQFTFGFPPIEWALDAYLKLLEAEAPGAPWMIAGLGVEIDPLIAHAVARGGHVRVGLEDRPFGCTTGNLALTEQAARSIARAGGKLATAADIRAVLGRT